MQTNPCQSSIVSYAGLAKNTLFDMAKQAFARADFDVPQRFSAFLPIFPFELIQNMDYVGVAPQGGGRVAASGFSIDPGEYHRKLFEQIPELYEGDNYRRNFDYEGRYLGRSVFTVDKAWAIHFPQYQPFMGEKLMIHLLGGGHQAVAVPESIYPRGMGVLSAVEARMGVTARAKRYVEYVKNRTETGEEYQAEAFAVEYLALTGLEPIMVHQNELGRLLQDLSIAKSLQQDAPGTGLFTENAKRAEHIRQYVPFHYACDSFEACPVTRHTARLCQPYFEGMDFISDFWIPYQDVNGYVDKQRMVLDMARLCEGYQIAPAYDSETGGGLYPDRLLVMIVRDREIPMMTSDVLNNPAYGGGMSPQGMIGRHVYIHDSRELLRQRKLMPEETEITAENTALSPKAYLRTLALASLQELKGKLVDAMYRREAALSQMTEDSSDYEKAKRLLDEKVGALEERVERQSAAWKHGQVSGYDADISYLRRKCFGREGTEEEEREPIAFAQDANREQSIESGYAMRDGIVRVNHADLSLEQEEDGEDDWGEDAELQPEAMDAEGEAGLPWAPPEAREEPIEPQPSAETPHMATHLPGGLPPKGGASTAPGMPKTGMSPIPIGEGIMAEQAEPAKEPVEKEAAATAAQEALPAKAPAMLKSVAPRKPHTFADIAPRPANGASAPSVPIAPKANSAGAANLANIVRREPQTPATASNQKGKMASLVKKNGRRPSR
jgi:hypothetical protein